MTLESDLEARLIELSRAKDSRGLPIRLGPMEYPTAVRLRDTLGVFSKDLPEICSGEVVFVNLGGEIDPDGTATYFDNIALLARATAAALRVEAQR